MNAESRIDQVFRLLEPQRQALSRLSLKTVGGLLRHFPTRYSDLTEIKNIHDLAAGETVSIYGTVRDLDLKKSFRSRIPMAYGTIEDMTGEIKATWFHQPYIAKMLHENATAKFTGKISENKKGELYISNPEFELVDTLPPPAGKTLFEKKGDAWTDSDEEKLVDTGKNNSRNNVLYPIYPETRGITSKWFYHAIQKIFLSGMLDSMTDDIPDEVLKRYNLPGLRTALIWIHIPRSATDAEAARKRFAFEEVFLIQLQKQKERLAAENQPAFVIEKKPEDMAAFTDRFPFKETAAQKRAIATILNDFQRGHPMSRLLEGDVGSGKTAVAATTAYAAVTSRPKGQNFGTLQVAYMCPTEILAGQHFESFIKYFASGNGHQSGISVGLITGSGCKKFPSKVNPAGWTDISRTQLLKWVAGGEIPILIGTHALIQKSVVFKHLAYVIIDEQHRFGTNQRQKLVKKNEFLPHLLSMTATPIPRTLALTIYGDLDLTLLDEMPAGRKPIITEIVPPTRRTATYEKIRTEIMAGRQAYVICPRIDEPDPEKELAVIAKSVKEEAKRLKKQIFPEFEIGVLHGKMSSTAKEETMSDFAANKIQILVATSVVEVGVNVPNATMIMIEGAERFGLAQLHQLRGRVIRSTHQSYCYVFSDTTSAKSMDRLKALQTAKNGFELAELDLGLRGSGDLYGRKQWGISDLGMEALKNLKMVEAARTEARAIVAEDPNLAKHPSLKARVSSEAIHFE